MCYNIPMKHSKPEFNTDRGLPQSEVDKQDESLRGFLREGLMDVAMGDDGGIYFNLTEKGKLLKTLHPLDYKKNDRSDLVEALVDADLNLVGEEREALFRTFLIDFYESLDQEELEDLYDLIYNNEDK